MILFDVPVVDIAGVVLSVVLYVPDVKPEVE